MNTIAPATPIKSLDSTLVAATGITFAMPPVPGTNDGARSVTWRTAVTGVPTTVAAILQGAMNNVEAEFATLDETTEAAGELRTISNILVKFIRIKLNTLSGGSTPTFTGELLI